MFSSFRAPALVTLLSALLAAPSVQAVSKITRTGKYLFDDNNNRFYIKGVAYQEIDLVTPTADNPFGEPTTFTDPLANLTTCQRDLPFLQNLTVNAIRVYSVDATLNHDGCMNLFSQNNIYVLVDLALPLNGSIDRASPSWSTNLLDSYTRTIDVFSKYDNVLAFNVGNEVVTQPFTTVAPYVKAAARDIKAYLQSKGSSALVGYTAINGPTDWRSDLADYLTCDLAGNDSDSTSIDLYGLNNYNWCGDDNFQSAYAATNTAFEDFNVVAYFSEFGSIMCPPRLWTEVVALFGSQMTPVWSGGIAYSYLPAGSAQGQFGMVNISSDGSTVTTSNDFTLLAAQYSQVQFINSPSQASTAASTFPSCAPSSATFNASDTIPPTPNETACDCVESALDCQFIPNNDPTVVGQILDTACSLLGQSGGSCDPIGGSGFTGTYGILSGCSPNVQASFAMSSYFEVNGRTATACSFAGNGTVNPSASSTVNALAVANSCNPSPSAVFTPSPAPSGAIGRAPGSGGNGSSGSGTDSGSSPSNGKSAAIPSADARALFGMSVMAVVCAMGALFTLA